jgi:hypothetical protein
MLTCSCFGTFQSFYSGSLNALSSTAKAWIGGNCSLTSPNTSYSYGACNLNTGSPRSHPRVAMVVDADVACALT